MNPDDQQQQAASGLPERARSGAVSINDAAGQSAPRGAVPAGAERAANGPDEDEHPFIVGVAASAGGLEALRELLRGIEPGRNLALVIAQHLSPTHRSVLAELLAHETRATVRTASDGELIQADTVYVTPANRDVEVVNGRIWLCEPPDPIMPKPSADRLFRSLADDQADAAAAVVLSGTGSDGAGGVRAIKAAGGAVFVQDPVSASYDGMPRSVVRTGCADVVPTPGQIGSRLARLAAGEPARDQEPVSDDALERVIRRVHQHRRMDLSAYREGTLLRRLHRRLVATGARSIEEYEEVLGENQGEMDRLCRELLISVTGFFRDWEAFEALRRTVEQIVKGRGLGEEIRIWVPGCATGEEAYSVGILLAETLGEDVDRYRIQIFATDLDEEALAEARQGIYPAGAIEGLPAPLQERYFVQEGTHVRVVKFLRELMVFARQDLLNDPPFTRLDLVSCRNVLIYFRPETQHRVLELFHYALRGSGRIFLGRAEGIGGREHLYSSVDSAQRIYQRRNDVRPSQPRFGASNRGGQSASRPMVRPRKDDVADRMRRVAIEQYVPPSVLVDASLKVLQTIGDTSQYLALPAGEVTLYAQNLVREELRSQFITLVTRSHREGAEAVGTVVWLGDERDQVQLRALPVRTNDPGDEVLYLVSFEAAGRGVSPDTVPEDADEAAQQTIAALRAELTATREHLSTVTEELERANQELQSTNEELQSSNEELQSSNEELETSNEELQSTNEELTTVNEELNRRTEELSAAYDELTNVMDSLSDPLLVLDERLRLRRFNPAAREIFEVDTESLGTPITTLGTRITFPDLADRAGRVMRTGEDVEQQLSEHGETYLMRIRPYRDRHGEICGCVILMVDQTGVVRAERGLRESEARLVAVLHNAPIMASFSDVDGRYRYVNPSFEQFFRLEPGEAVGAHPNAVLPATAARELERSDSAVRESLSSSVVDVTLRLNGEDRYLWLHRIPVLDPDGELDVVCTLALEVTDWTRALERVRLQAQALNAASDGVLVVDANAPDLPTIYVNQAFTDLTGYEADEVLGRNCRFLQGPESEPEAVETIREAIRSRRAADVRVRNYRKDGTPFPNRLRINPVLDDRQQVTHYVGILTDISREVEHERELMHAWRDAEAASRAKSDFLSAMSHELRTPLNAILGFAQLLTGEDEPSEAQRREYYQHVLDAGWHLRDLVSEILDLARIEAGRLKVHIAPVEVRNLVDECLALTRADAADGDVHLDAEISDALYIAADAVRAKQILVNLLSNAVKYNRRGGSVTIQASSDAHQVRIDVTDTGMGVDVSQHNRLFQAFDRLGQERGTVEGTGIGLVVSQHLARLMGGDLVLLSSTVGEGTTFRVTLPHADPAHPEDDAADAERPRGSAQATRVLYVEDNEINITLVRGLIERRLGVTFFEARDGASGIHTAREQSPDLILLDLHLPDMSGFDVMQQLRADGLADHVPVVAVSADAMQEQRERAFRSGFSDYLVKPFRIGDLDRLLAAGRDDH